MTDGSARQLVLASGNPGKLRELQDALAGLGWQLVPQGELGVDDVEETGRTFIENAILKARHAAAATGLPALADDSGLVVPTLGGAPGIYSARYSGQGDAANNTKLLAALEGVPESGRGAWFVCVLAFMVSAEDPSPRVAEGRWHGRIATAPRGEGGFGYDPVFIVGELNRHAAELSAAEKRAYSHRGKAVAALHRALSDQD